MTAAWIDVCAGPPAILVKVKKGRIYDLGTLNCEIRTQNSSIFVR